MFVVDISNLLICVVFSWDAQCDLKSARQLHLVGKSGYYGHLPSFTGSLGATEAEAYGQGKSATRSRSLCHPPRVELCVLSARAIRANAEPKEAISIAESGPGKKAASRTPAPKPSEESSGRLLGRLLNHQAVASNPAQSADRQRETGFAGIAGGGGATGGGISQPNPS